MGMHGRGVRSHHNNIVFTFLPLGHRLAPGIWYPVPGVGRHSAGGALLKPPHGDHVPGLGEVHNHR